MEPDSEPLETHARADIPHGRGGARPLARQFEVPDADELSGSFLPSPPPGDESWFDWAQRFWPSLAQSLNGRLPER